ncbi:hypothetical protein DFH09DRAFT_1287338, partial [Mycena vulgaris]
MSSSNLRTRLNELDQEIPQLKLQLKELERERSEIFASLTFPTLTLPVEITSEIFMHRILGKAPPIPRSSEAPLLLTRICRQWRETAISTPRLWTTFSFPADAPQSEARDYLINYWLSLSPHQPLSIDLHVEADDPDTHHRDVSKSIQACLGLVGKYSSRWRDVRLCLKPSALQHSSISFPAEGFPLLEHLAIGVEEDIDDHFDHGRIDFFGNAPRLRSVEIVLDMWGSIDIQLFTFPWSQLTNFTGTAFSAQECVFVLERTPALVDCTFLSCQRGGTQSLPPLAPMPILKSFISKFLGAINSLPGLEMLGPFAYRTPGSSNACFRLSTKISSKDSWDVQRLMDGSSSTNRPPLLV